MVYLLPPLSSHKCRALLAAGGADEPRIEGTEQRLLDQRPQEGSRRGESSFTRMGGKEGFSLNYYNINRHFFKLVK